MNYTNFVVLNGDREGRKLQQKFRNLEYCPETGVFRWTTTRGRLAKDGNIAGSIAHRGHRRIRVEGRMYYAHRLAWLFVNGAWPNGELDHANMVPDDNRIANLRIATPSQNRANRKVRSDNKSGYKGVYFDKQNNKWCAAIQKRRIGRFKTPQEAHAAYCQAAKAQWGEYARVT